MSPLPTAQGREMPASFSSSFFYRYKSKVREGGPNDHRDTPGNKKSWPEPGLNSC